MSETEIPVTITVQSPGTFVFVPEQTLHFGHSLGDSVSEALGVVTLRTAEKFAREGDPPSCPTCVKQHSDGSSATDDDDEELQLHRLIEYRHVLDRKHREIRTNVRRLPTDHRKSKCKRFTHVKSSFA